ncbi:MAG: hypothetical protein JO062_14925 [Bryobacterales bacterium]|nr:hypothetical protein [Bryobacterales bacterium]
MNSTTLTNLGHNAVAREHARPTYQAYQILHVTFIIAPIVAGLDKFFHLLTNWDQYLAPWISGISPIGGHHLMQAVGVVEIIAGLLVWIKPRLGAPIVAAWLCLIILNLITMGTFLDIALRDLGLALGAAALWRLALEFGE